MLNFKVFKSKYALHLIALAAIIIRILVYFWYDREVLPDSFEYLESGRELWSSGMTTADDMMPLYPLFIFASQKIFGFPFLDILISGLTVYFVFGLTDVIGENRKISLVAAVLFATWPMSVFYSGAILTESLFVFLFLGGLLAAYKKQLFWCILLWVLSLLTRPVFDLLYPVLIAAFLYSEGRRKLVRALGMYLLLFCLIMSPWWVHNYHKYGSFVRLNLGIGYVLYEGNHLQNKDGGPAPFTGQEPFDISEKDPIIRDQALKSAAIDIIKSDPLRFLKMSWKKFLRLWNPFPNHESYQGLFTSLAVFIPTIIIYFGTLLFLIQAKKKTWIKILPFVLCILFLTAIHMITVASIRYRYPVEPLLLILATIGIGNMIIEKYFRDKSVVNPE